MSAYRQAMLLKLLGRLPMIPPWTVFALGAFATIVGWALAFQLAGALDGGRFRGSRIGSILADRWRGAAAVTALAVGFGLVGAVGWLGLCLLGRLTGDALLLGQGLGTVAAEGAAILVLVGGDLTRIGWKMPGLRWVGVALLVAFGFDVLSAGWESGLTAAGVNPSQQELFTLLATATPGRRELLVVGMVIVAPLFEEHLFRGAWYGRLAPMIGVMPAIAVTGLSFGICHLASPWTVPVLMVFGAGLGWLRARSGSIWPGFIAHALSNAVGVALLIAAPMQP